MSSEENTQSPVIVNTNIDTNTNTQKCGSNSESEKVRKVITLKEYKSLQKDSMRSLRAFEKKFVQSAILYFSDLIRDAIKIRKDVLETQQEKVMMDEILKSMASDDIIDPLPKESVVFEYIWDTFTHITSQLRMGLAEKKYVYESMGRTSSFRYYSSNIMKSDSDSDTGSDSCSDSDSDSD